MQKFKTVNDFKELQKVVDEINKGTWLGDEEDDPTNKWLWNRPYKLRLLFTEREDGEGVDLEVLDDCEELYYEGFQFEETMEKLETALKVDTEDKDAYFDCVCPGRWMADFEGRWD